MNENDIKILETIIKWLEVLLPYYPVSRHEKEGTIVRDIRLANEAITRLKDDLWPKTNTVWRG